MDFDVDTASGIEVWPSLQKIILLSLTHKKSKKKEVVRAKIRYFREIHEMTRKAQERQKRLPTKKISNEN